jgi:uncharacterized phiE125 gp8 family phage protein
VWTDAGPPYFDLTPLPLRSITSIKYIDGDGTVQTLADTDYVVTADERIGRVTLGYGKSWPTIRRYGEAVTIRYVSGYAKIDDIPAPLMHWIKLYVESSNRFRGMIGERETYMSKFADGMLDRWKSDLGV